MLSQPDYVPWIRIRGMAEDNLAHSDRRERLLTETLWREAVLSAHQKGGENTETIDEMATMLVDYVKSKDTASRFSFEDALVFIASLGAWLSK